MEVMSEKQMQLYANEKAGYNVELLPEYAMELGYEVILHEDKTGKEVYIFKKV